MRSPEGIYVGLTALLQAPVVEIFSGGLVVNQGAIQGNLIRLEGGEIQNQGSFEGTDVQLLGTALEKPLERFDGLQALAMPGSTIIHSGAVVAETAFIQAEYIDLQKESSIVGKMILIGGEKTRIVKINGEIAGEEIQAFSDAALINHGKIQGKIEAKAPYLWELP
ncbi:MAG: hypothetical protein JSS32_01025 [Verrucomicrobia bacterium]|nr:hypothetical protein [Verrucomicrobiota bacterium]